MSAAPSVLIVDASSENREVLRTVLERRGLSIFEAAEPDAGLELARACHPDVIVLDVEGSAVERDDVESRFAAQSQAQDCRLIVLGKLRRGPVFSGGHAISKPYHYAPLVHTIERLAAKAA